MEKRSRWSFKSAVAALLSAALIGGTAAPPKGFAMLAPIEESSSQTSPEERAVHLKDVRAALESKQLRQRLAEFNMTPEQIDERLKHLSEEEIHQAARRVEALNPGGDATGVLVIVILVLLIVYLFRRV